MVQRVYGENLANIFHYLGVTHFLDINIFIKTKHYPSVSSIWLFGKGGSYDFNDPNLGDVNIYNGTIASIEGIEVPFGEEYYRESLKQLLITKNKYETVLGYFDTPGTIIERRKVVSFEDAEKMIQNGLITAIF